MSSSHRASSAAGAVRSTVPGRGAGAESAVKFASGELLLGRVHGGDQGDGVGVAGFHNLPPRAGGFGLDGGDNRLDLGVAAGQCANEHSLPARCDAGLADRRLGVIEGGEDGRRVRRGDGVAEDSVSRGRVRNLLQRGGRGACIGDLDDPVQPAITGGQNRGTSCSLEHLVGEFPELVRGVAVSGAQGELLRQVSGVVLNVDGVLLGAELDELGEGWGRGELDAVGRLGGQPRANDKERQPDDPNGSDRRQDFTKHAWHHT
jgi:hypothetical protein